MVNYHICENDRGYVTTECLKEGASDPKYLHRQRSSVTFTMFYSFSLTPERGGGEAMLGIRPCFQSATALPHFTNHYSNEIDLLPHPCT